jgi:TatD DNase family protein
MIVDSHSHLDMHQFDPDREEIIQRAQDAGLEYLVTIATAKPGEPSLERTLDLAAKHPFIYAGIGIHPHDAAHATEALYGELEKLTRGTKVVLWGEIGLDYYYDFSPREVQREVFRTQLRLAKSCRIPVAIHCRDAWEDLIGIVTEEWSGDNPGGILHSFTGNASMALEAVALGFHISYSGIASFKNAREIRAAAAATPLERILLETDSPYLAPVPHRGKRNEPSWVQDVARSLAGTLGLAHEDLCRISSANFRRLAGL